METIPLPIVERMDAALAGLDPYRQEEFALRCQQEWPVIVTGLTTLYGTDHDPVELAARLIEAAANGYAARDPELLTLDRSRLLTPDWLQRPDRVGYACYAERFAGDLAGVAAHLDYLGELGVNYVHMMPLLRPRDGDNDGGYAVANYREVRPDLGTTEDLRDLATALRRRGMSLVVDLVLNHVAKEHEWAEKAKAGDPKYRDYFYAFPDRTMPDAYEATLPEVFPDFAPGNFTWDDEMQAWVWTTFNLWQWDVKWSNPDVLAEYVDIILFLTNLGVEVLRLDAIAFTWKRMGTNCQNQPEVHDLTAVIHAITRLACPAVAFKAEAIVGPRDLIQYLGTGSHVGEVSDLAYHNSLMVQGWSMLAAGDTVLTRRALRNLPATPTTGTWIAYTRCHDDIGWAIDDRDAESVGLNGFWHRRFLADWYAGEVAGSWARGLVFQYNEETGDKRTSGTAASLCGLEAATTQEEKDHALARIFLIHAIAFGWGGIPVIWSGDELATLNDPDWDKEVGHEDDNRWAHRPRLDWTVAESRDDLRTETGKVFHGMSHLASVRKSLPQLHASADAEVLDEGIDRGIFAVARRHASGPMLGLYNVTQDWRPVPWSEIQRLGFTQPVNALGNRHSVSGGDDGYVWLAPFSAWWVVD